MADIKEEFKRESEKILENEIFSPEFKKRKVKMYLIRTLISVIIIYFLWDYEWVNWVLYIYIPINILSLLSIFLGDFILKRKIKKTKQKIDELDSFFEEE